MSEYRSKTKRSKCGYCGLEMLDDNLKAHCRTVHKKDKLVKGQQTLFPHTTRVTEPKTKKKRTSALTTSTETTTSESCTSDTITVGSECRAKISVSESVTKSLVEVERNELITPSGGYEGGFGSKIRVYDPWSQLRASGGVCRRYWCQRPFLFPHLTVMFRVKV